MFAWNHENPIGLIDAHSVSWDTLTTGNFGGVDLWLAESPGAGLEIASNHVSGQFDLGDIGLDDVVLDAGGLERKIRVFRLPEKNLVREFCQSIRVSVSDAGDNPLWVRVTTEDGFLAWSSPIFLYR